MFSGELQGRCVDQEPEIPMLTIDDQLSAHKRSTSDGSAEDELPNRWISDK